MLREFGALPSEKRVRALTDRDYLWCLLNLVLDEEEALNALCPACRAEAQEERCPACGAPVGQSESQDNAAFDWARYERMKGGGRE